MIRYFFFFFIIIIPLNKRYEQHEFELDLF